MKPTTRAAALFALTLTLFPATSFAGPVEQACMRSDRGSPNARTCACIQGAADATLSNADQRRAARLFANPDDAQAIRVSKGAADNAFWARYKSFGATAVAYCGG
ncbi:hypothetical protein [Falsirhodobacter sp. alg1]|uniref:hypothetical protein n=1 Tax=Falsirhodobacter sp. alg1 TaxID=1472418 RepID=UPI0005EE1100|nr:hypothetical protein [Falsirhodobacter sp. alg1]